MKACDSKITALIWAALFTWLILSGPGWAQTISVTLRTPNGGETWEAGSARNITWETSGSPGSINLYYSLNNGSSFTTIVTGMSDAGSYTWPVPAAVTNEALVSIEAVKGAEIVTAESAAPFSIVDTTAPSVTVEAPNGGEKWQGGSAKYITFEATDLFGINSGSLYIWYSTDNGSSYPNLITSDAAVASPYAWTLPSLSTTEVKVRVSVKDSNANPGTDESNAKFTIDSTAPAVTVIQPNGGETIIGNGATYEVKWAATDECGLATNPNPITLRYSTNKGTTWTLIATNEANDGSYIWTVPYIETTEARVSVEAVNQVGLVGTDKSDNDFTIMSDFQGPVITVDAPSISTKWRGGTTQLITFEATDPSGIKSNSLSVWYSTDEGSTYTNQVSGTSEVSPYHWPVPSNISTTEVKIRLQLTDSSLNNNVGTGESAVFTIDSTAPYVTVVQPNGGETIIGNGATYEVKWAATDECGLAVNPITLRYSTNEGTTWIQIAANEANDGSYIWTVPYIETTEARVSVEAVNQVGLVGTDKSDTHFTIISDFQGPVITVDAPAGGETWKGGSTHSIAFHASDPSGIKSYSLSAWYSTDNGLTYSNQITSGASSVSPYSWTLPSNISTTEVKVRLQLTDSSLSQNIGTGESAQKFTIDSTAPYVTVVVPNGGELWSGNNSVSTETITWAATDECGLATNPITIRYSTNSGASWTQIVTNITNSGSYTWTVPHINTSNGRVSVEATNLVGLVGTDMSDHDFLISSDATGPTVTVEAPAGGEVWKGGSTHFITFEATDPSGVKPNRFSIYYSTSEATLALFVITSEATFTAPGPYTYSWSVPTINSQTVRIWVTARDIYDNLGTGESATFTVDSTVPTVTISSPTGGEKWQGGTDHNITWTASDNFNLKSNPITLQYSTNEGVSWINIVSGLVNSSPYSWSVPSLNTNEARVRVIATDEAGNDNSSSSSDFIIDITPPSTPNPLTQLNGSATNDATPYFSWSAATDNLSGISSYEITIDTTVTTQAATTNYTPLSNLSDGFHTWKVKARDGAGIWGDPCTPQTFEVITATLEITGITLKDRFTGSTLYAKNSLVTLEASGVGANATQMMSSESSNFVGAAWQAYQNPSSFLLSPSQGAHTVYYKVRDAALNESSVESAVITLDTNSPSVSVLHPNAGENLGGGLNYTISWYAYDVGVGFAARPITIRFSSNGGATWSVVTNEANSGSYAWIVPPGIDSTTCLISIEADDLAGNGGFDWSSDYFNLISFGPAAPTQLSPANGSYVNTRTPQLQWASIANAAGYQYVLDLTNEADTPGTSYLPNYFLAEGPHTFWVRAVNAADLWSASSETSTFIVDVTSPTLSFAAFTDNENPQPNFHGTITDNFKVVSAEARLDSGPWLALTAADGSFNSSSESFVLTAPSMLARGTHTLEAVAYDAAGNVTSPSVKIFFLITKSVVAFDVTMGGSAVATGTVIPFRPTFTVDFTSPLPIVDFKVYIDGQSVYAHTGSFTSETVAVTPFQDLAVGSHSLIATALNIAGDVFTKEVDGLTVISDVRVFMTAGAATISLAVNTSSSGPATLILRKPNGQTILQKTIPDIGDSSQITLDKYIAGENLKGPYLWKIIYNSGRSSKSGGFIVP